MKDFLLWLFCPTEWTHRNIMKIFDDHTKGVLKVLEQVGRELGELAE